MATPPESTKTSLTQRLRAYAADIWPDHQIKTRFRGQFAYIDAVDPDGDTIALCRLRYAGSASMWGFGPSSGQTKLALVGQASTQGGSSQ
jgi:hypothetical protein